jgi:hypothetical protein
MRQHANNSGPERSSPKRTHMLAFALSLAMVVSAAAGLRFVVAQLGYYIKKTPIEAPDGRKVTSVPTETASWKQAGVDARMSEEMVAELGTENYVSRTYVEKNPPAGRSPRTVELHMAYYTGMVDTVPHIPDRCLVGGGWSIAGGTQVLPLKLDNDAAVWREEKVPEETGRIFSARLGAGSPRAGTRVHLPRDPDRIAIRVNPYSHPKLKERLYAGYFFIANGGHCDAAEDVRRLAFNLTDSYAYYLKVQVSTLSVANEAEFAETASSLLGELLPEIMLCVPDWVEVLRGEYPPGRAGAGERAR